MAATASKSFCVTCNTERGIFKCDGCSQIFCFQHTTDHHQDVIKQIEPVEDNRNLVQKTLSNEMAEPRHDMKVLYDELANKIDDWENESINKIRKAAKEAKNELFQHTVGRLSTMKQRLEKITMELQQARKNNAFVETDLREWNDKLNKLKEEIIVAPIVAVQEDYTKLISNIRVTYYNSEEIFARQSGNGGFEEGGKVVYLKDGPDVYTEVRGKYEYSTGQHTISMKVEQFTGWLFFGIISKSTPMQIHSYISPSCYGWYNGSNFNYAAGQVIAGQGHDAAQNDTIHLVIDCDNRLIRLINERTNQTLELSVDITKCPFPWQTHLNLNVAPTRIRITS